MRPYIFCFCILIEKNNYLYPPIVCAVIYYRTFIIIIPLTAPETNGNLKKKVSLEVTKQQSRLFERLQNKPFWIWNSEENRQEDIKTNGDCCFNHIIGLPNKDGTHKPLYDYQRKILESLVSQNSNKHLWIKKAT